VFGRIFLPWSLISLANREQRDHHRQPRTQERNGCQDRRATLAGITITNSPGRS
jgi:hypothetical protein